MNPFDYVNAIQKTKQYLITDEITEKEYNPFMVNRALSMYYDCVIGANEMNIRPFADKKMQFDFHLNTVRAYKRPFVKWNKSEKNADIESIKLYFGYSTVKAKEVLSIITPEQLKQIKMKTDSGGLNKVK